MAARIKDGGKSSKKHGKNRQPAGDTSVSDHLKACTICHNTYTRPVTLRCGHTFCQSCAAEYATKVSQAIADHVIPCILGCRGTPVPDPQKPPEEWVKQLEPSLLIKNLMEITSPTSELSVTVCSLCSCKEKSSPPEKLCSSCGEILCKDCSSRHRTDAATRNHELMDYSKAKPHYATCTEHDSPKNVLCEVCNVTECSICWCLNHRACGLPERRGRSLEEDIAEQQQKAIEDIEKNKADIASSRSMVNAIIRNRNKTKTEINTAFQRMIDVVKRKEVALLEELETVSAQKRIDLQGRIQTEEAYLQIAQQQMHFIKNLSSMPAQDTIDMYHYVSSGQAAIDRGEGRAAPDMGPDIIFSYDTRHIIEEMNRMNFGSLVTEPNEDTPVNEPGTPYIDAKLGSDKLQPDLYELTVVIVDGIQTLVVTDQENKCAKAFYTRNNKACHSNLSLDDVPNGIAYLPENKVLIPSTWSRQIVTLKVTPDLEFVSSVITGKGYTSLAVLSPTSLAASCGLFQCVDILDMAGNLLKSFGGMVNSSNMFTNPWHICAKDNRLMVSDRGKKAVVCMTTDGEVLWTYVDQENMLMPSGITTTGSGNVLVGDRDGSKLIVLTDSGKFVREIPTSAHGISELHGVYALDAVFICGDGRINNITI